MLTLTRKVGEIIRLDGGIKIIIKEVRKGRVSLGIEAPEDIGIYREEVFYKTEEKCQAPRRVVIR